MSAAPKVQIFDHQSRQPVLLESWQAAADRALPLCLAAANSAASELHALNEIEINLVDDDTIAGVHAEFLRDPTPTDVITFPHGEIFISLDTAQRQAAEMGEPYEREVARYIVHALLHLAGWDDRKPVDRAAMHLEQERILDLIWPAAA
jgi:probable rRNA maturation factor